MPGLMRQWLRGVVAFVGGTLLLGVVGDAVSATYAERSEALELKSELADKVMLLTGQEANAIVVLAGNLEPSAQLNLRCRLDGGLPSGLNSMRETICADAALQEIIEEQERNLRLRETHLEGTALASRLGSTLTDTKPSLSFSTLLNALEQLRKLNSSTTCGNERKQAAVVLRSYDWMTDEHVAALVGPPTGSPPCDDHGEMFGPGVTFAAGKLVVEAGRVASEVRQSKVEGLRDTPGDLVRQLIADPLLLGMALVVLVISVFLARSSTPAAKNDVP